MESEILRVPGYNVCTRVPESGDLSGGYPGTWSMLQETHKENSIVVKQVIIFLLVDLHPPSASLQNDQAYFKLNHVYLLVLHMFLYYRIFL